MLKVSCIFFLAKLFYLLSNIISENSLLIVQVLHRFVVLATFKFTINENVGHVEVLCGNNLRMRSPNVIHMGKKRSLCAWHWHLSQFWFIQVCCLMQVSALQLLAHDLP